jgi:hypothetical protein
LRVWIAQYIWALLRWSLGRWRVHQAVIALLATVGGFLCKNWFSTHLLNIPLYMIVWLLILILIVAPACLWRQQEQRLRPKIAFVDHEDNHAVHPEIGLHHGRVTLRNCSAILLTGVEVKLAEIEPRPSSFITLHVPLWRMHARDESKFSLQPEMIQSVDLIYFYKDKHSAYFCHTVETVPKELPRGVYRIKLIASANEASLTEQWFKVETGTELRITREG